MPQSPANQFSAIFVSYRRDDSAGHAGRLSDKLGDHFGKDQIFMDIDNIKPGADFVQVIENAVGSCEILIAIIGQHWLSGAGETSRWLDNPNDFVRLEIAAALDRDIRVIPVLVQRATMPKPQDLPDDLTKFTRRHAIELTDIRWQRDVDELISVLEGILASHDNATLAQKDEEQQRREVDEKSRAEEVESQRRQGREREQREAEQEQQRREVDEKRRAEEVESQRRQAREREQREVEQEAERHQLAERDRRAWRRKRTIRFIVLAFVFVVVLAGILVIGGIGFYWMQTISRDQNLANQEDVWQVAIISNKTSDQIPYLILDKGLWVQWILPPGGQRTHVLNEKITVKYDNKYEEGSQEKQFDLRSMQVVDHYPTGLEQEAANKYYFQADTAGIIGLYPEK